MQIKANTCRKKAENKSGKRTRLRQTSARQEAETGMEGENIQHPTSNNEHPGCELRAGSKPCPAANRLGTPITASARRHIPFQRAETVFGVPTAGKSGSRKAEPGKIS
jgi:hypothetical protein